MQDVLGRSFDFATPPRRVVSLVPSLTETLFALGVGDSVVGITDYCIFPENLDVPKVGGTKNPHVDAIRMLAPDLVYMNLEENLGRHGEAIEKFAPVFVTEPKSVPEAAAMIAQLGEIHGRRDQAAALMHELEQERAAIQKREFTFACAIWKNPWMWCGGDTYVSSVVASAGGTNVLASSLRYPQVELADVLALSPDIIFLPDEPYAFSEEDARAIEGAKVIGPFPGHLFTWHGVRTIEGLRFLREALATIPE